MPTSVNNDNDNLPKESLLGGGKKVDKAENIGQWILDLDDTNENDTWKLKVLSVEF